MINYKLPTFLINEQISAILRECRKVQIADFFVDE